MATKGAGNHYGNARGGRQGQITTHTGFAWAKGFNKKTLDIHVGEHAKQMGCMNANEYVSKVIHFANTVDRENCVSFIAKNDSTYKYNRKTNEFAIITKDGYVVTYYKPEKGYQYYLKEKKNKERKHGKRGKK